MPGIERQRLAALIRTTVMCGPPRTAREIAAVIRSRTGVDEIHRREVNSVLYGELACEVRHDQAHRWSLRAESGQKTGCTVADGPRDYAGQTPSRAEVLRVVGRLRSGLPPQERILDLTVGGHRLVAPIQLFLNGGIKGGRTLLVQGDYGEGKSHTLALIGDMARSGGVSTTYVSADGFASALNHPQRFLPLLCGSLEVPGRTRYGYEDLLHQVLHHPNEANALEKIARRRLTTNRQVDLEVAAALQRINTLHAASDSSGDELESLSRRVAYHLTGESSCYKPAIPSARDLAYTLIRILSELLAVIGCPGLVIAVDEAESIFTKLHNAASRRGAYRVLAALCNADILNECRVAIAMTPDGWRELVGAVGDMAGDRDALPCEPVRRLAEAVSTESIPPLACTSPRSELREDLLHRVRSLYVEAHPAMGATLTDAAWQAWVHLAARRAVSLRVLVRQAVDHLDRQRYANRG